MKQLSIIHIGYPTNPITMDGVEVEEIFLDSLHEISTADIHGDYVYIAEHSYIKDIDLQILRDMFFNIKNHQTDIIVSNYYNIVDAPEQKLLDIKYHGGYSLPYWWHQFLLCHWPNIDSHLSNKIFKAEFLLQSDLIAQYIQSELPAILRLFYHMEGFILFHVPPLFKEVSFSQKNPVDEAMLERLVSNYRKDLEHGFEDQDKIVRGYIEAVVNQYFKSKRKSEKFLLEKKLTSRKQLLIRKITLFLPPIVTKIFLKKYL